MQIHLFVSDSAPARIRIKAELEKNLPANTIIYHQSPDDFHRITIGAGNEPIASVVRPANNKELSQLAQIKNFWSRSKNILILPDEAPETLKLAGLIRPVFITGQEDDFSKVVLILKHIKNRFEIDIQKP
jgi:hypothetical protein